MIEQGATVVAVEGSNTAWVETRRGSACGACAMNKGCGAGVLAQALGFATPRLRVVAIPNIEVGDQVVIGVDERALVRGSFSAYIMPILFMLAFALAGDSLAATLLTVKSDLLTTFSGGVGLVVGLAWLRRYGRRVARDTRFQPVILHREAGAATVECSSVPLR